MQMNYRSIQAVHQQAMRIKGPAGYNSKIVGTSKEVHSSVFQAREGRHIQCRWRNGLLIESQKYNFLFNPWPKVQVFWNCLAFRPKVKRLNQQVGKPPVCEGQEPQALRATPLRIFPRALVMG